MKRSEVMALIEGIKILRENADDKTASAAATLYPTLKQDGALLQAGCRINFQGQIYRSRVDLWDMEENNPINAPDLWEMIEYKEGYRIIPQTITAEHPFIFGEKGWWNGKFMESLLEVNVWNPDSYPDGWKIIDKKEEINNG